jgi:uncharacterized protein (TIRG00374 family)
MGFSFNRKHLLLSGLAILVLVVLLAVFVDWQAVRLQLSRANSVYLAAGTLLLILGYLAYALRWQVLLVEKLHFKWTFHAANAGSMVNLLLPLRPGDAARILMLGRHENTSMINVTTSIVVERWYEQIMRIAALGGAIVFGAGIEISWITILGSVAYLLSMLLVMVWMVQKRDWLQKRLPRWIAVLPRINEQQAHEWIETLLDGFSSMAKLHTQGQVLFWSIVCWTLFWGYHYLFLIAIQPDIGIETALALSLGSLALVPPSATTLPGVYQLSMIVPLAIVGYDRSLLASYAVLMNLVEMIVVMALGLWGVMVTGMTLHQLIDTALIQAKKEA